MTVQSENERNKRVVDEYLKAGVQGHLTSFPAYLHPDFTVTAPNYLPWNGRHVGAAFFRGIGATEIVALDKRAYASAGSEQERNYV
jgi:ketosteroid isomerase-like protein